MPPPAPAHAAPDRRTWRARAAAARGFFVASGLALLLAGCGPGADDGGPGNAPRPAEATETPRAAAPPRDEPAVPGPARRMDEPVGEATGRNRAMGTGEPLDPQPFTLEQRFLHAVRQGDRATVERLLAEGVSVEAEDALGRSALLLAVRDAGSLELARFLHARGAAVDDADKSGRTALSWAAGAGRLDLVGWLLAEGAASDRPDHQGRTPLFHAVARDRPEVVRRLLEAGADADVRDQFGDTPLMVACAKGLDAMARLLLSHGADPSVRDQEGRTAAERAAPGTPACREAAPAA
ncbi:MAG: ankyrin repeat domain-containing protein [Myxococcota bacterium]|nr:ankyrin repeat domain-containing protein [Myxococcota bacterium]